MKKIKYLLLFVFTSLVSCDSDDTNAPIIDEEGKEVALVNPFPNLSFNQPLDLQSPDDGTDRIFVVEKRGRIVVFENDSTTTSVTDFLNISTISSASEQGLLGLAFHPNYSSNGYFYIFYTPNANLAVVSRFTVSDDVNVADAGSEVVILEIPQPETNHNGGQLSFGPDGYLYIAVGDGGGAGDPDNNAQNRTNLLGNILRIDVDNEDNGLNYAIPATNPFVNEASVRPEIFAYGLRNPWRMSFDVQDGSLWAADVGQGAREEINTIVSGGNYGWRIFEGNSCFSGDCETTGLEAPIFEYGHDNGDRSVTGGFVYRGTELPSLVGKYVYGDFVSGRIWALDTANATNALLLEPRLSIASFGTDNENELYVCDFGGTIYKFALRNSE
ncbi:PQQ-dependent sugar dehydrogenase [Maribacter chungangensis]|uniref:PQQ-dependent sugar dehydrogenase n=1 Tax=Maribacter chungangensis TaxID=1069117 RepID=A0ABW3B3S3_9FLAO